MSVLGSGSSRRGSGSGGGNRDSKEGCTQNQETSADFHEIHSRNMIVVFTRVK